MFRLVKSFDCQRMPEQVKRAFFRTTEAVGNDCHVSWEVQHVPCDSMVPDDEEPDRDVRMVDDWLLANGAEDLEIVLINHWW